MGRLDTAISRAVSNQTEKIEFSSSISLAATIHPDIKRTLNDISDRTGMNVSQVTDEVLYTGLIEMQEI